MDIIAKLSLWLFRIANIWPIQQQRIRFQMYATSVAIDAFIYNERETQASDYIPTYLRLARQIYGFNATGEDGAAYMMRRAQLGALMWISAQWEPGLELVDESMQWFRTDRSTSDETWVTCRMNIGVSLLQLGRYKEAIEWLEMAKEISRWVGGKDSFGLAQCHNNLGIAHQHLEQFDQAVAAGREALRLYEINSGGRSRGVAISLNNLAMTLKKAGMIEEAETAAVRAASLCEFHKELLGSVADTMAEIYEAQGKLQQAVAARARAIWAIGRWEKPGRLIEVAQKQANLLERMGRKSEAADCRQGIQNVRLQSYYGYSGRGNER